MHINIHRFTISWGRIPSHHHFAKAGEVWTSPWKPSQPRPVLWQLVRAESCGRKLPAWILWIYPVDGSAIHIECGLLSKAAFSANKGAG